MWISLIIALKAIYMNYLQWFCDKLMSVSCYHAQRKCGCKAKEEGKKS